MADVALDGFSLSDDRKGHCPSGYQLSATAALATTRTAASA